MTSTHRFRLGLVFAAIVLILGGFWLFSRHQQPIDKATSTDAEPAVALSADPVETPTASPSMPASATKTDVNLVALPTPPVAVTPQPAISQVGAATPTPAPTVAAAANPAPPTPAPVAPEVAATRRMYGAHAPLRTPAVANPDSEQNRQILQTMVTKALSRASEAKPAAIK